MSNQNEMAIYVPTKTMDGKQGGQELYDVSRLTQDHDALGALKHQDPFLYHSIPAVHKATLAFKDIDSSEAMESSPAVVARQSRVTTECHISLLLEDILEDDELFQADADEDVLGPSENLLDLLFGTSHVHDGDNNIGPAQ